MEKKELNTEKIGLEKHQEVNESLRTEWKKFLALPFFILFTVYDIWIVEGLFAPLQIWDSIHVYHQATYYFLIPGLIIFISLALGSWKFLMYSAIGIYSGWLDILYFLLQVKNLPPVYEWLPFSPTSIQLITLATMNLLIACFVDFKVKDLSLIHYLLIRKKKGW